MLTPQITVTPAAEKFIRRMVRFSEFPPVASISR